MIAEGRVFPNHVEYNALPWKYSAGTPNILGAVVSAQALRLLLDLALTPKRPVYFGNGQAGRARCRPGRHEPVAAWNQMLTSQALDGLGAIEGITIYGPRDAARRTSLVAFNLAGRDAVGVARALNQAGIGVTPGCHCATLAHHALGLNPPASCRLSFYLYNTPGEVDRAVEAVAAIAAGRSVSGSRFRSWQPGGAGPAQTTLASSSRSASVPADGPRRRPNERDRPGGMRHERPITGCGTHRPSITERFTLASTTVRRRAALLAVAARLSSIVPPVPRAGQRAPRGGTSERWQRAYRSRPGTAVPRQTSCPAIDTAPLG